ncbi:MAG: CBO2463/CBO2479 domain-containing protein [Desulfovibrio sp.]|uniref:CBO2463/CBO2479 domain-containing protein n=1 Tax=Desulfovibrio sp. 7SRBS1 TaxID=3378064 RepID=UPI003B416601
MEVMLTPKLLPGKVVQVTEMSVVIELKGRMGVLHLPLRSVFTEYPLAENDPVEIYISCAQTLPKQAHHEEKAICN